MFPVVDAPFKSDVVYGTFRPYDVEFFLFKGQAVHGGCYRTERGRDISLLYLVVVVFFQLVEKCRKKVDRHDFAFQHFGQMNGLRTCAAAQVGYSVLLFLIDVPQVGCQKCGLFAAWSLAEVVLVQLHQQFHFVHIYIIKCVW